MFKKNTLILLRIPFSFYLMPVYFFALSQSDTVNTWHAVLIFFILHLFIYPASNGYNSYQDKDEKSIGGLKYPPKVTKDLFYLSLLFDFIGLTLSLFIGIFFFTGVLVYMLVSRAYSSRKIRLKKYPVIGFLSVIIFQGAFSFLTIYVGISGHEISTVLNSPVLYAAIANSFLIGGVYPLTQIYQHVEDIKNGDRTISIVLGYKGTFIFSMLCFLVATAILFTYFQLMGTLHSFYILQLFLLPVILFFLHWMRKVFVNTTNASFENTMLMNSISSLMLNVCFIVLYFL